MHKSSENGFMIKLEILMASKRLSAILLRNYRADFKDEIENVQTKKCCSS
jgi:hypothetical protein